MMPASPSSFSRDTGPFDPSASTPPLTLEQGGDSPRYCAQVLGSHIGCARSDPDGPSVAGFLLDCADIPVQGAGASCDERSGAELRCVRHRESLLDVILPGLCLADRRERNRSLYLPEGISVRGRRVGANDCGGLLIGRDAGLRQISESGCSLNVRKRGAAQAGNRDARRDRRCG
jgi:hypothetical protein